MSHRQPCETYCASPVLLLDAAHAVGAVVLLDLFDEPVSDDLIVGGGFEGVSRKPLTVRRLRSLPDRVGPDMRLLVCGLNPSLYAADQGVNFARPGNRFWP